MIAILFLFISSLFGWCLIKRILPEDTEKTMVRYVLSFVIGVFISVWLTFLFNLFFSLTISMITAMYILSLGCFLVAPPKKRNIFSFPFSLFEGILLGALLLFSFFLITQSLHFTLANTLQIGGDVWGDFDIHLPLIRSFAWGGNMPPSLPSFPNANASYHFMFDYFSGILENGGLPLSYAFNIPSILSFASLGFLLYSFSQLLFPKKKGIGILTVVFFLCNSSLEFLEGYQKLHRPNILQFLYDAVHLDHYFSLGPYKPDMVSIIWNMNVYLNQRHIIFGFAVGLSILFFLYKFLKKGLTRSYGIGIGICIGLTVFWSIHVFLCLIIITTVLTLFYAKSQRHILFILPFAIIFAFPQMFFLSHDVKSFVQLNPGFLAVRPLTLQGFFLYWVYNLGISLITIPLGFILVGKEQKKWFVAFFAIFIIANIVQFNSDIFNNHKLFNFWLILSNMLSAYVIFFLFSKKTPWKWLVILLMFLLTFSGFIDIFVVKNEALYTISDYPADPIISWVATKTAQHAIFLLPSDSIYNQIRLAGRKTFAPSPRYADSYGYDVQKRNLLIQHIFRAKNVSEILALLKQNHISYVVLPTSDTPIVENKIFFEQNFPITFSTNDVTIYAVP